MASRMWAKAMENDKLPGMASSGDSNSWMNTMNMVRKRTKDEAQTLLDPQEAWKLWFEATVDIWRSVPNMGGDPLGVIAAWVEVMENVQEKIRADASLSIDPSTLLSDWCHTMNKLWSSMVKESISSEQHEAFTTPFLEGQSGLISALRHASEAYARALRMPTLSDITRVAELVVNLEEKVDSIGDTIERVKEQTPLDTATMATITGLEQRLNQIESKLDTLVLRKRTAKQG